MTLNKNFFAGLLVGLGLLLVFAFRPGAAVQKWEYKTATYLSLPKLEATLNDWGPQGWELVENSAGHLIFKRPME